MCNTNRSAGAQNIVDVVTSEDREAREALANHLVDAWMASHDALFEALDETNVRRWARGTLLSRLEPADAAMLAERLLAWPMDFQPERRDRSTLGVVNALSGDALDRHLIWLACSNAVSALWERIAGSGQEAVINAVGRVIEEGDTVARETTLHLLVLDPYGPEYLSREEQDRVLMLALDDRDPEIRGLAAEVVAADMPEMLIDRWQTAPLDAGERVRMAFWRAALMHRQDDAAEAAGILALDRDQPLEARRTALLALGENRSTRAVAPVLQQSLTGDEQALAEDAAQLMWRHHRAPDIANAAAASPFESVRDLAERLLHPERGSPAAGGSRPGDPTRTREIFDQIRPKDDKGS
jgi:hypothetical protein